SSSVVVSSRVVSVGVVVVGSAVAVGSVVAEPPSSLPAMTTIAITRPTITAIRQATNRRRLPRGRPPPGGPSSSDWRMILVGSSCICREGRVLGVWAEDRVEDRVGVVDLETGSQPRRDLLPARPRDRHLGRQQAGARGRSPPAPGGHLVHGL